jgi:hypothetical protein
MAAVAVTMSGVIPPYRSPHAHHNALFSSPRPPRAPNLELVLSALSAARFTVDTNSAEIARRAGARRSASRTSAGDTDVRSAVPDAPSGTGAGFTGGPTTSDDVTKTAVAGARAAARR